MAVLPLSGGPLTVDVEGRRFELDGRATVFSPSPTGRTCRSTPRSGSSSASGAELALPSARATRRFDPAYVAAGDVAVEVRGAGPATRQVTNFMSPEAFDGADKLMCVELLTPDGNWSSYPPHRHDDSPECPVNNEEIYYFRIGHAGTTDYAPDGFALHRTYTPEGDVDATVTSATGTCSSSSAATTARASPHLAIRCTTSTCSLDPTANDRWRSATTRRTTGCASRGSDMAADPRVPMSGAVEP